MGIASLHPQVGYASAEVELNTAIRNLGQCTRRVRFAPLPQTAGDVFLLVDIGIAVCVPRNTAGSWATILIHLGLVFECGLVLAMGTDGCQISKEREAEANHADSEMLRELSKGFGEKRRRLERAGEGLQVLMAIIERRRDSGWEVRRGLADWAR